MSGLPEPESACTGAAREAASAHDGTADATDPIGAELAAWGRVILLTTTGRRTGIARTTPVGFLDAGDGSLLIAATDEATAWARNLAADPRCIVSIEGAAAPYRAEPLGDEARRDAIVALILRYGTPAERLGMGPAFRLRPDPRAMGVPG